MNYLEDVNTNNEKGVERFLGIDFYSTSELDGIGGLYKHQYSDFIVREITQNGITLEIKEDHRPVEFSNHNADRYTTFNLIKVNKNTFGALREISNALGVSSNKIQISGLKDKNSISVQKVSIVGDHVSKLRKLKIRNLFFRCIGPSRKPVRLGSNQGNHFTIVMRDINPRENLEQDIHAIFNDLKEHGFINCYGIQRFGRYRPNSHRLGYFLLKKDYKSAHDELLIKTYLTEMESIHEMRDNLRLTRDYEKALEEFPSSMNYERNAIKYLITHPEDYEGALNTLPRDLLHLLLSAFQSFVFNKMISLRIKKGISLSAPVKGDVISIKDEEYGHITKTKYVFDGKYDEFLERALKLNRAQIVVPIIGYNMDLNDYPLMKTLFEEVIASEGIDSDVFKSDLFLRLDFKGSLRSLSVKPMGLNVLELADDDLFPGKKKLKFEFSLHKGSYATRLIREIRKFPKTP